MADGVWTIGRVLKWTEQYFKDKGIDTPRLDGEVLLANVLQKERIYCYAHYDQPLQKEELSQFRNFILRRVKGESVATIIEKKEFMALPFYVNKDVLIPRNDTEVVVEKLLTFFDRRKELYLCDMCTGSGAILLSALHYGNLWKGLGVDLSKEALAVAKVNQEHLGLTERSTLVQSDLFQNMKGTYEGAFDVLVSNPPYIRKGDMASLPVEVQHEPAMALDGGADGLDFYRQIAREGISYITEQGYLFFEIGQGQEEDIIRICTEDGVYRFVEAGKDLSGIVRLLVFQKQ